MSNYISEELEEIGRLVDTTDNLLAASTLPVSDRIHAQGLKAGVQEVSTKLKAIHARLSSHSAPQPSGGDRVKFTIESEQEVDGRWLAEVLGLPGVIAYGKTDREAVMNALFLALRALIGEGKPTKEGEVQIIEAFIKLCIESMTPDLFDVLVDEIVPALEKYRHVKVRSVKELGEEMGVK
jgi:predicted RNase H-like HicB family nuclease